MCSWPTISLTSARARAHAPQGYDAQALEALEDKDVSTFVKQEQGQQKKSAAAGAKGKGKEQEEEEEYEDILDSKPFKELGVDPNKGLPNALHDWV